MADMADLTHFVEGKHFHALTDHKLCHFQVLQSFTLNEEALGYYSPVHIGLRYIRGTASTAAGTPSQVKVNSLHTMSLGIAFKAMAEAQLTDPAD